MRSYVMVDGISGVEVTMLWGDVCDHAIIVSWFGNRTSVFVCTWVVWYPWYTLVPHVAQCVSHVVQCACYAYTSTVTLHGTGTPTLS